MTMQMQNCRALLVLVATMGLLAPGGCASWRDAESEGLLTKMNRPWRGDGVRRGVPRRMVATWTNTVKHQPGVEAKRGFGGRVYFYDHDESEPIGVEGQFVVYAFDETDRRPDDNSPTKRFVFPPEQVKLHESESEIGVSYSFWLPWDKGGTHTDISLMARFEPVKGGTLIVSDMSRQPLPGMLDMPNSEVMIAQQEKRTGVFQTSAVSETAPGVQAAEYLAPVSSPTGMQTTTIKLPSSGLKSGQPSGFRTTVNYGRPGN